MKENRVMFSEHEKSRRLIHPKTREKVARQRTAGKKISRNGARFAHFLFHFPNPSAFKCAQRRRKWTFHHSFHFPPRRFQQFPAIY